MTATMQTPDQPDSRRSTRREPVTRPVRAASDREAIERLLQQASAVRITKEVSHV